jgi:hypothetical protein
MASPFSRPLGKAIRRQRATVCAQAFVRRHRQAPPRPLIWRRNKLVAVAGLGLIGPLANSHNVAARLGRWRRIKEGYVIWLVVDVVQSVQAQVVAAPLEHRERGTPAKQWFQCVDEER